MRSLLGLKLCSGLWQLKGQWKRIGQCWIFSFGRVVFKAASPPFFSEPSVSLRLLNISFCLSEVPLVFVNSALFSGESRTSFTFVNPYSLSLRSMIEKVCFHGWLWLFKRKTFEETFHLYLYLQSWNFRNIIVIPPHTATEYIQLRIVFFERVLRNLLYSKLLSFCWASYWITNWMDYGMLFILHDSYFILFQNIYAVSNVLFLLKSKCKT